MTTRRDLLQTLPATGAAFAVAGGLWLEDSPAAAQPASVQPPAGHFHPLGKPPSRHTIAVLEEARRTLPFADTRDFEENRRGFIAPMPQRQIANDSGGIAWDMDRFAFIDQRESFDSIHPSLHRIARFYGHRFNALDAARIILGRPPTRLAPLRFARSFLPLSRPGFA